MATAETSQAGDRPEMATLEIRKGPEAELAVGGLRVIACRREIGEIDGGISLYVWSDPSNLAGAAEKAPVELLRVDLFRNRPHYHAPAENQAERRIEPGEGDAAAWGVDALTSRAADLAREAGQGGIADALDGEALAGAGDDLAAMFAGLGEPNEVSFFEVERSVLERLGAG